MRTDKVGERDGGGRRDVVVIGASAGGAQAVADLLSCMPEEIRASFLVVLHVFPEARNHVVELLNSAGPLTAKHAEEREELRHGFVYLAPPDRHLIVKKGFMRVTRGPRENRWRPAIDPLFRSAAVAYGPRVIGVILTGMLDDGTAGLVAVKRCGGLALVQDPGEAAFSEMPHTALANVAVDHCLPLAELARVIARLVNETVGAGTPPPDDLVLEARIAETGYSTDSMTEQLGELTGLSCPECGGPLWEKASSDPASYRCRVGHAYSVASLQSAQQEAIEAALWAAVRLLDQRANVLNGLAARDRQAGRHSTEAHHERLAREAREQATVLRGLIVPAQE